MDFLRTKEFPPGYGEPLPLVQKTVGNFQMAKSETSRHHAPGQRLVPSQICVDLTDRACLQSNSTAPLALVTFSLQERLSGKVWEAQSSVNSCWNRLSWGRPRVTSSWLEAPPETWEVHPLEQLNILHCTHVITVNLKEFA